MWNFENKKAVSLLLSYVILITIALTLSGLVYAWLKWYVADDGPELDCEEEVSLSIKSYEYNCLVFGGEINMTVKNNGLHNVSGFVFKVHDRVDATIGKYIIIDYPFAQGDSPLAPGDEVSWISTFSPVDTIGLTSALTLIEVQPYKYDETGSQRILCSKLARQPINC